MGVIEASVTGNENRSSIERVGKGGEQRPPILRQKIQIVGPDIQPPCQLVILGKTGHIVLNDQIVRISKNIIDQQHQRENTGKDQKNGQNGGALVLKTVPNKPNNAGYGTQGNQQHAGFGVGFQTQDQTASGEDNCRDQIPFIVAAQGQIGGGQKSAELGEKDGITDHACKPDTSDFSGPDAALGIDGFSGFQHEITGQGCDQKRNGDKHDNVPDVPVKEIFTETQNQNRKQHKPGQRIFDFTGGQTDNQKQKQNHKFCFADGPVFILEIPQPENKHHQIIHADGADPQIQKVEGRQGTKQADGAFAHIGHKIMDGQNAAGQSQVADGDADVLANAQQRQQAYFHPDLPILIRALDRSCTFHGLRPPCAHYDSSSSILRQTVSMADSVLNFRVAFRQGRRI